MDQPEARPASAEHVRRARRSDVDVLLPLVGGPKAGRARAVRRIQKSLESDLYVLERHGQVCGAVHVVYRRSLAAGGLVATVDCLAPVPGEPWTAASPDLQLLVETALRRAQRRGCVAIDAPASDPVLIAELDARGFAQGRTHLHLTIEKEGCP